MPDQATTFHSFCRKCQNIGFRVTWTADKETETVSGGQFQCIACGDLTPIRTPEFTSIQWNMK